MAENKKRVFRLAFLFFISIVSFTIVSVGIIMKLLNNMLIINKELEKKRCYINLYNRWVNQYINGKRVKDYIVQNGYKNIAIYGWGDLGKRLFDELRHTKEIDIQYIVDKSGVREKSVCKYVKDVNEIKERVDLLIITPFIEYDDIKERINNGNIAEIISLEDIIYEM